MREATAGCTSISFTAHCEDYRRRLCRSPAHLRALHNVTGGGPHLLQTWEREFRRLQHALKKGFHWGPGLPSALPTHPRHSGSLLSGWLASLPNKLSQEYGKSLEVLRGCWHCASAPPGLTDVWSARHVDKMPCPASSGSLYSLIICFMIKVERTLPARWTLLVSRRCGAPRNNTQLQWRGPGASTLACPCTLLPFHMQSRCMCMRSWVCDLAGKV